jgi:hypothetical protein
MSETPDKVFFFVSGTDSGTSASLFTATDAPRGADLFLGGISTCSGTASSPALLDDDDANAVGAFWCFFLLLLLVFC